MHVIRSLASSNSPFMSEYTCQIFFLCIKYARHHRSLFEDLWKHAVAIPVVPVETSSEGMRNCVVQKEMFLYNAFTFNMSVVYCVVHPYAAHQFKTIRNDWYFSRLLHDVLTRPQ